MRDRKCGRRVGVGGADSSCILELADRGGEGKGINILEFLPFSGKYLSWCKHAVSKAFLTRFFNPPSSFLIAVVIPQMDQPIIIFVAEIVAAESMLADFLLDTWTEKNFIYNTVGPI